MYLTPWYFVKYDDDNKPISTYIAKTWEEYNWCLKHGYIHVTYGVYIQCFGSITKQNNNRIKKAIRS